METKLNLSITSSKSEMEGKPNNNRRSTTPNPSKSEKILKFNERKKGLKKKIYELSTLCGLEACMISIGPDGEIDTWPDEKPKLESIINRYRSFSEEERRKNNTDISKALETKKKKLEVDGADISKKTKKIKLEVDGAEIGGNGSEKKKKKKKLNSAKYPSWDERLDGYSEKQLRELKVELDTKMENVKNREELKKKEKEEESEKNALVPYTSDVPESSNTGEFLQELLFDQTVLDEPPPWCCSSSTGVSSLWEWDYWNQQPQMIYGSTTEFTYADDPSSMKFDRMIYEQSASNFSYGYETMDHDLFLMCQMGTQQSPSLLPVISHQQTPPPLATILPSSSSSAQQVFRFHTNIDQDQIQVKGGGGERGPTSINC